jgi:protein tyrosine/serine phosphatase
MKFRQKRVVQTAVALICFLGIVAAARFWYLQEQGNFHAITPGEAYRSAQLDQDLLQHYIRKLNIRSIINLRGDNAGDPWYDEETAVCQKMAVNHYDLGLSADKTPTSEQIAELLRFFRMAPRPVLIHCQGGADRSGLAAALWKVVVDGAPKAEAGKQLSILYGHIPFGPTQAMDAFFKHWTPPAKAGREDGQIHGKGFSQQFAAESP